MPDLAKKCEREKAMVHEMIALYCNRHHNTPKGALCEECARLSRYAVMRYSAPRMLYIHPIAAIRHVVTSRAEKRRLKKEEK